MTDKSELKALAWYTEDHLTDRSATTYSAAVAASWMRKGWPVHPLFDDKQVDSLLMEIDKLRAELAGLRTGYDAQNNVIAGLKAENEELRMRIKEMDLMFGRYLLGMRASVIEWQDGKGADAAMHWIWNGLVGPGELPPRDEKEAKPYFDREIVQIENAQQEVFAYWDRRRAEKDKEASHG